MQKYFREKDFEYVTQLSPEQVNASLAKYVEKPAMIHWPINEVCYEGELTGTTFSLSSLYDRTKVKVSIGENDAKTQVKISVAMPDVSNRSHIIFLISLFVSGLMLIMAAVALASSFHFGMLLLLPAPFVVAVIPYICWVYDYNVKIKRHRDFFDKFFTECKTSETITVSDRSCKPLDSRNSKKDKLNFVALIEQTFIFGLLFWGGFFIIIMISSWLKVTWFNSLLDHFSGSTTFLMVTTTGMATYVLSVAFVLRRKRKRQK